MRSAILALLLAIEPLAAECIGPDYPCAAFANSKNVFVARVTQAETLSEDQFLGPITVRVRLLIERVFKGAPGVPGSEVDAEQHFGETWINASVGERYLVFSSERLELDLCSRTHRLNAQDDFSILERLAAGEEPPVLSGIVRSQADDGAGIPNVWYRFSSRNAHVVGRTESDGTFAVEKLDPGSYMIQIAHDDFVWRPMFKSDRRIDITKRGCAYANIRLRPNNQLSGRLVDANGKPLKNVFVTLDGVGESWGRYPPLHTTYSKSGGKYIFDGILPGSYRVEVPFLNSIGGGRFLTAEEAADKTAAYYPGFLAGRDAATIEVRRDSRIDLEEFKLPAGRD